MLEFYFDNNSVIVSLDVISIKIVDICFGMLYLSIPFAFNLRDSFFFLFSSKSNEELVKLHV